MSFFSHTGSGNCLLCLCAEWRICQPVSLVPFWGAFSTFSPGPSRTTPARRNATEMIIFKWTKPMAEKTTKIVCVCNHLENVCRTWCVAIIEPLRGIASQSLHTGQTLGHQSKLDYINMVISKCVYIKMLFELLFSYLLLARLSAAGSVTAEWNDWRNSRRKCTGTCQTIEAVR